MGGLAVSVYCDPRFTRDVDLAVAIDNDDQVETLVNMLIRQGVHVVAVVEQQAAGRLAIARLMDADDVSIDLLVGSSGIEREVVAASQVLEVVRGLSVRVARIGHLIALKLLSISPDRATDGADLRNLAAVATDVEWDRARDAVRLIMERGFARGRRLDEDLEALRRL